MEKNEGILFCKGWQVRSCYSCYNCNGKKIKHEINFSFFMPKKIRQWQTCSNVYHSLQNATQTKLLKLANMNCKVPNWYIVYK